MILLFLRNNIVKTALHEKGKLCAIAEGFWVAKLQVGQVKIDQKACFKNSNLYVLFLCSRDKVTNIFTCCIVFQFESSWCAIAIRVKIKEELVAWRDLARWCRITIFSNHRRSYWTTIIYGQFVQAETIIPISLLFFNGKNIKHLTNRNNSAIQNEENLCESVDQFVIE